MLDVLVLHQFVCRPFVSICIHLYVIHLYDVLVLHPFVCCVDSCVL